MPTYQALVVLLSTLFGAAYLKELSLYSDGRLALGAAGVAIVLLGLSVLSYRVEAKMRHAQTGGDATGVEGAPPQRRAAKLDEASLLTGEPKGSPGTERGCLACIC